MVELGAQFASSLEILAFPCNQFGRQEPASREDVKKFAISFGIETNAFHIMDKVSVNGPATHPVFSFLKSKTQVRMITWNFGTYFVVSKSGGVRAFSDVSPSSLIPILKDEL